jgi:hypothetical protein
LEHLTLGDIQVSQGREMKMLIFSVQASGISNFKIEKSRISLDPLKFEWIWFIPKISTQALYSLKWDLGPLKLKGKGDTQSVIGWFNTISSKMSSECLPFI